MSTVATQTPVRHGTTRLRIKINSTWYTVRRSPAGFRGCRIWHLTALNGPRKGEIRAVCSARGTVGCSCPDCQINKSVCKHIRALQALGLVNPRAAALFTAPATSAEGGLNV